MLPLTNAAPKSKPSLPDANCDPARDEVDPDGVGWSRSALLWLLFVSLGTGTQLGFKLASRRLENIEFGPEGLKLACGSPALGLAIACYGATFALWIVILQRTQLSKAFLLTALDYVTVTLGSALWLGESINYGQMTGIGLVILGVALLGLNRESAEHSDTKSNQGRHGPHYPN